MATVHVQGLDIGPDSLKTFQDALSDAKTVIWNGPMGVFEYEKFAKGTYGVAETPCRAHTQGTSQQAPRLSSARGLWNGTIKALVSTAQTLRSMTSTMTLFGMVSTRIIMCSVKSANMCYARRRQVRQPGLCVCLWSISHPTSLNEHEHELLH